MRKMTRWDARSARSPASYHGVLMRQKHSQAHGTDAVVPAPPQQVRSQTATNARTAHRSQPTASLRRHRKSMPSREGARHRPAPMSIPRRRMRCSAPTPRTRPARPTRRIMILPRRTPGSFRMISSHGDPESAGMPPHCPLSKTRTGNGSPMRAHLRPARPSNVEHHPPRMCLAHDSGRCRRLHTIINNKPASYNPGITRHKIAGRHSILWYFLCELRPPSRAQDARHLCIRRT
jgi:hypothetical protein